MGKRHRRTHVASYVILMVHLLKWQFQPDRRSRSWVKSVERERSHIARRERVSSDFTRMVEELVELIYRRAVREVAKETRLPISIFPAECPYTVPQLRNHDWMPE